MRKGIDPTLMRDKWSLHDVVCANALLDYEDAIQEDLSKRKK